MCHSHSGQFAQQCNLTKASSPTFEDVPAACGEKFVSAAGLLDANAKFKKDSSRTVSFNVWCSELMMAVLRSRTFFSAYVVKAIRTPRTEVKSTSAIYPMPVPFPLAFRRMPPGCSSVKRHKIHFLRAINVVVLALNFWWSDGRDTDSHLLGRALNRRQLAVVSRIRSVMLADGPGTDIPSVSCGRKFPQLIARLSELSEAVTRLGVGAGAYSQVFQGTEIKPSVEAPELQPYRSLDSDRLKLTGSGNWDATGFLSDELALAYRYPDILLLDRIPRNDEFPQFHDDAKEVGKLARLWDSRGLLFVHKVDIGEHAAHEAVRVFNNYKNPECDRQIGDRRGRNAVEARVSGPSAHLPAGTDLMDLWIPIRSHRFSINVTDRSDFYHQFAVSENRALSNTVFPALSRVELESTNALAAFSLAYAKRSCDRLKQGDRLKISSRQQLGMIADGMYHVAFKSIFQGDHAGVEVATDAHIGLLQRSGLLCNEYRLESDRPFGGKGALEGLVIDDYFSIGIVPRDLNVPLDPCTSDFSHGLSAVEKLERARDIYKKNMLNGSPHKDIVDADSGKVIGAWLNSSTRAAEHNVATLGSPVEKRLGLSLITLAMCQQRYTTDSLLICLLGAWTSVLGFRRQILSILNSAYGLVDASKLDSSLPKLVSLPRSVCQELVLVSILSVMAVTDLSLDVNEKVFATDASMSHGAIVSTNLPKKLAWMITRMCKSKGAYTRILSPFESVLKSFELLEETGEERDLRLEKGGPSRPLAFHYDFIEVFAGGASVSDEVSALGFVVGPPIDLSYSSELDGRFIHIAAWLTFMIASGQLLSVACEPPCTTFSIMRRPALRDKEFVFGFLPHEPQTHTGNTLAQRSFQISYVSWKNSITALLETPWSSKLKNLPSWRRLLSHEEVQLVRTDSCAFGSIHKKSFAFLGVHANMSYLDKQCCGGHEHVIVQGSYTKASASYTPLLSKALAQVFQDGILRRRRELEANEISVKGLENQLLNEVLLSSHWTLDECWEFKSPHHINILELAVVVRLVSKLAKACLGCRVVIFVDSNVVKCAVNKGRSSSKALAVLLKKLGALSIGGGVYPLLVYSPTRLNPADDPTRNKDVRQPVVGLSVSSWDDDDIRRLSSLGSLKRFASNWSRLVIGLLGPCGIWLSDRSIYRSSIAPPYQACYRRNAVPSYDFDATLGFPGEGPLVLIFFQALAFCRLCFNFILALGFRVLSRCLLTFVCCVHCFLPVRFPWVLCCWSLLCFPGRCHGAPIFPRNPGDATRAAQRFQRPQIQEGRPVLEVTATHRRQYYANFLSWCQSEGIDLDMLLETYYWHVDEINTILTKYGRAIYSAGWPYLHYAETINGISQKKPALRRQLQGAWDFAYGWLREEPPSHHRAMPWQVLLALLTTALSWGWLKMAGMMALSWGALLRVGEFCAALRSDLLLPEDTRFTNSFCLIILREPKTRFSAARHQSAKLDIGDLLEVVSMAFRDVPRHSKLWPYSSQTLRNRFRQLLTAVGLPTVSMAGERALDPGSLRPGGATWLLQQYESGELVQRRGRWMNYKVMSIYIQEVGAYQYLAALEETQRRKILDLATLFPSVLKEITCFSRANIPETVWWKLLYSK